MFIFLFCLVEFLPFTLLNQFLYFLACRHGCILCFSKFDAISKKIVQCVYKILARLIRLIRGCVGMKSQSDIALSLTN